MKKNNYGFYLEENLIAPLDYDYCYSINQNLSSLSLRLKGILYNNASLLFFISLFNLFQDLNEYTNYHKVCYESYSQALTTYFLKCCDRMGIIKIISCEKQEKELSFNYYYEELNNESRKYFHKIYDVKFIKIRSFEENDLPFIQSILRFLKIDEDNLVFKYIDGKLKLNVKTKLIINNISKREFLTNIKNFIPNYFSVITDDVSRNLSRRKTI